MNDVNYTYKLLIHLLCCTLLICVAGCEGYSISDGTVKDKLTNLPLDSVYCVAVNSSDRMYTDSAGTFNLKGPFGSCVFGCKDIIVEFSRNGYTTQKLTNPGRGIIILLGR